MVILHASDLGYDFLRITQTEPSLKRVEAMPEVITEIIGGEIYQYYPLGNHVVRAIGVCGGRPTFKYTRIEITGTLERLAAGESIDDIVKGYRGRVSREAIIEAISLVNEQFIKSLPVLEPAL
ncbi:MAG: DUF433 domain-containing protein [candidate division KSB1 bacterium]|nr:DUF433 domain-containing protein [candidate division KSB1 bacterium]MDZ7304881.1 DUF433 domain-containing protein [candidate division KSB1 bacterium]MDZ7314365.1 DUF433 domain-containing protein [candidate division KSB1 bacterium]